MTCWSPSVGGLHTNNLVPQTSARPAAQSTPQRLRVIRRTDGVLVFVDRSLHMNHLGPWPCRCFVYRTRRLQRTLSCAN